MKAPLSWLKEYVDIDCSEIELKDKLFSCGFEVENLIYVGKNIDKIVTCKILQIEKHPNADKLSVTKVDAGKYGILQIITNAKMEGEKCNNTIKKRDFSLEKGLQTYQYGGLFV